ncbi:MAG: YqjK-like family protein [Methylacidiphilales bacterium]|nr:YqjK-like family protein [Candidatus Methylacidiphilales bacterium]
MNPVAEMEEDFSVRRARLIAQIAQQRGELAAAYQNLERPIHYAEYGMRGFGFLRQNPWIFMAVPAVVSIAGTLLGSRKGKGKTATAVAAPVQQQKQKPLRKWAGYAWELFQLYRRVRPYFL